MGRFHLKPRHRHKSLQVGASCWLLRRSILVFACGLRSTSVRAAQMPSVLHVSWCRAGVGMEITEKTPHRVVSLVESGAARACGEIQVFVCFDFFAHDNSCNVVVSVTHLFSVVAGTT